MKSVPMRAVYAGVAVLIALVMLVSLAVSGSGVDRQRNDAVARVVQTDGQLDAVRKNSRAVKKAVDDLRSAADQLGRAEQGVIDIANGGSGGRAPALAGLAQSGVRTMTDATTAFRTASRSLLESYATLGLYQGDIRAARQLSTNIVATLQDGTWSYVQGYQGLRQSGGSLSAGSASGIQGRFAEGDRAQARVRLALDNWSDAASDLWRSALNRRNQPLVDARRLSKPFPFSLFDRSQLPPDRSDSPDQP